MPIDTAEFSGDFIAPGGGAGGFEPQRVNNFMLDIALDNLALSSTKDNTPIRLSLKTFPFPADDTEATVISFINSKRKVPGATTYADMDLVVTDYVDQLTAQLLDEWRRLVFDPRTGMKGLAKAIKAQATLSLFAPNNTLERRWKLIGLWPRALKNGAGNMESNDVNVITVTFALDYWYAERLQASA